MNPFGIAWSELELANVADLLRDSETEPLLWEAKGEGADKHHVIKTVAGFANSHDGGWLIIGADEAEAGWRLPGIKLPDEPAVWIANVVRDNLRPAPPFDVRHFPTGDSRHVVVVQVEPVAAGPCIARGTVYERLPGKCVPVKEPLRLAELYRRGDLTHRAARDRALGVCDELLQRDVLAHDALIVTVGVSALTYPKDIGSNVFTNTTVDALFDAAQRLPGATHPTVNGMLPSVWEQSAVTSMRESVSHISPAWQVRAQWDGAVGVLHTLATPFVDVGICVATIVKPAWAAAVSLAAMLGGGSGHYLAVRVAGGGFGELGPVPVDERWRDLATLARGPLALAVDDAQLQSLARELGRVRGDRSPEPDAES